MAAMESQESSLPGAQALHLAAAKLARCRALNAELARLVQRPLDVDALQRVSALQEQARAASAALEANIRDDRDFAAMWAPIRDADSGTAPGEVGAAPSDPDGPYRSSRGSGS
ncbi:MAG TPA: hypothetical protein VK028_07985 [Micromonosporaceae bacterium]|nr:hypothetical protein [Micromonosporaceae bacterium]